MDTNNDLKKEITFKVVLYQPEIPVNTGNIGRLCLGANAELHIIRPMRFFLNDKYLKRAGMDYWDKVKLYLHDDLDSFFRANQDIKFYLCSTKGKKSYHETHFNISDALIFGPESRGLPDELLNKYKDNIITIPMHNDIRSINLCNSVAIILYEGLRQINFMNILKD